MNDGIAPTSPRPSSQTSSTAQVAADLSIIVPTINEAENLPELVTRIAKALAGRRIEIVIVDDNSADNTREICADLARSYPVRLIVRTQTRDGLSGAVLCGIAQSRGDVIVVMDADLQHPPERIPALLEALDRGPADFVLGSRYLPGARVEERWGLLRRVNSWVATILARPFAGRVTDPMSGFFALRRQTYDRALRLTPLGYKIGLELMCKCRVQRVVEVPIEFALRRHGRSKLTLVQQVRYLEHLSRLYDFCFPRLSPIAKFLIVLGLGWFAGWAIWLVLLQRDYAAPAPAVAMSYAGVIAVTAAFHLRYVRTQREFLVGRHPWLSFAITSIAEWIACALAAWYVTARVTGFSIAELLLISYALGAVVRYVFRKEFLLDVRGLRRDPRADEI
jgi:glycosyltransferase involved in cell wall biosynthesis